MKFILSRPVLILILFFTYCSSPKTPTTHNNGFDASSLKPIGRYAINNHELELISSGAHFSFSFEGRECSVLTKLPGGHSYLQYQLDGNYQKRIRIESDNKSALIIKAETEGKHTVSIYKTTEAQSGPVFIEKIVGTNIQFIDKPKIPLIEFIGNSITCGAAADFSEMPCGTGEYHDHHNAYFAYGPRLARALGTEFILSSISGYGVYRNWNSDGPALPQVYEKTDFQDSSKRIWDFSLFSPVIVSIALGTNDLSNGDGKKQRLPFDSSVFISSYTKFVQLVKSKYPSAQIALLSSPMINGDRAIVFQNCLVTIKNNVDALYPKDKPVAVYFSKPMNARGCSGHPSVEDHGLIAEELMPFFKKLLQ